MKLNKFLRNLNEEQLSSGDNSKLKSMKKDVNEFIKNTNLDEMDKQGADFLEYTNQVKSKIDDLVSEENLENPEEVRHQLYVFFDLK